MVTHMGHLPLFLKEVLPMVADIATIISFVTLVLLKLLTIPLQSEWLTALRMNPCMTGLAQRYKVALIMSAALCQRQLMVYFLH